METKKGSLGDAERIGKISRAELWWQILLLYGVLVRVLFFVSSLFALTSTESVVHRPAQQRASLNNVTVSSGRFCLVTYTSLLRMVMFMWHTIHHTWWELIVGGCP